MTVPRRQGVRAARTIVWLLLVALTPWRFDAAQTIDTVIVLNANVFDEIQVIEYGFLARAANALHIKTRASVIRRTLLLDAGDPYDSARVAESERGLRALGVFRYVVLDTARVRGRLALVAATGDGWTTKPQANFSTAGGDATWEVGIVEDNLLGTATTLTAGYRKTPDRGAVVLRYISPQFLFRRAGLFLEYSDRSDGRRGSWRYGVPFYQTAARRALWVWGEAADEDILQFRDGALDSTVTRVALRVGLSGGVALRATSRNYVRLWGTVAWRREDFVPDTASLVPRSVFGSAGVGVEVGHVRFRVLRQLNSYSRREDVNLSQLLRVGVWAAPRAWGYPASRSGIGPEVRGQVSTVWRHGFAVLRGSAQGALAAGGVDSGRVRVSVTVADQTLPRQTWLLFAEGGVTEDPKPGDEFDLWFEGRGLRLFGAHAFTGTRMVWGTLENRILVDDDIEGLLGIGVAPFLDLGGAWFGDQSPSYGGNVGLALRMGPTRSVRAEAAEIAFGYRFGEGWGSRRWALAIRKGFAF